LSIDEGEKEESNNGRDEKEMWKSVRCDGAYLQLKASMLGVKLKCTMLKERLSVTKGFT
jgi:hypothetical protein